MSDIIYITDRILGNYINARRKQIVINNRAIKRVLEDVKNNNIKIEYHPYNGTYFDMLVHSKIIDHYFCRLEGVDVCYWAHFLFNVTGLFKPYCNPGYGFCDLTDYYHMLKNSQNYSMLGSLRLSLLDFINCGGVVRIDKYILKDQNDIYDKITNN